MCVTCSPISIVVRDVDCRLYVHMNVSYNLLSSWPAIQTRKKSKQSLLVSLPVTVVGVDYTWAETWGTGGTVPPKFEVGGTAHALVPPIFREVVLSDVCERM